MLNSEVAQSLKSYGHFSDLGVGIALSHRQGGGPRVVVSTTAFHARVRGSVPGLGGLKETKLFLPHPRVKVSIVGSLRDREVACSASDRQGSNFESCVWRTVSSQSSHHPQEVLLAQFSLYVHKGGLKPDSFHLVIAMLDFSGKTNTSIHLFTASEMTTRQRFVLPRPLKGMGGMEGFEPCLAGLHRPLDKNKKICDFDYFLV